MAFLAAADYKPFIKDEIISKVIDANDTLRTAMEKSVEAEMTKYLAGGYDVANIFNKTGDNRNQDILRMYVDMVVYHLHKRINPGQVPQVRLDAYNEAKRELEMIARNQLQPDLPLVGDTDDDGIDDKSPVKYGGLTARDPYY